jgi:hypothetical protein
VVAEAKLMWNPGLALSPSRDRTGEFSAFRAQWVTRDISEVRCFFHSVSVRSSAMIGYCIALKDENGNDVALKEVRMWM